MKKYEMRTETVTREIVADITCNKCQKSLARMGPDNGFFGLRAECKGGYGSHDGIQDGSTWKFDLCEECVLELMRTFSIPAKVEYASWVYGV